MTASAPPAGEGWKLIGNEIPPVEGIQLYWDGEAWWSRPIPAPMLPTVVGTVISVDWRDDARYIPANVRWWICEEGRWTAIGPRYEYTAMAGWLHARITGFRVIAEPAAVDAGVEKRVRKAQIDAWDQGWTAAIQGDVGPNPYKKGAPGAR